MLTQIDNMVAGLVRPNGEAEQKMTGKVQQLITQDELTAGQIQQAWLDAMIAEHNLVPERFPAEITNKHNGDHCVTTLWSRNRPIAIAIRQRCEFNATVLTLVDVDARGNGENERQEGRHED